MDHSRHLNALAMLFAVLLAAPARGSDLGELALGEGLSPEIQGLLRSPDATRRRLGVEQLEGPDSASAAVAAPLLLARLADGDAVVRARAAQVLGRRQVLEAAAALIDRLSDPDSAVRVASAEALGLFGALPPGLSGRAAATFARALGDGQFEVRLGVLVALGQLLTARSAPDEPGALGAAEVPVLLGPLLLRVEDDNVNVRRAAVATLGRLGGGTLGKVERELVARAVVPLLGRLSDSARDVRAEALSSLAALGVTAAAPAALRLLLDPAEEVQKRAALCLGRLRAAAAVPALVELFLAVQPKADALRAAAARALGQIAGAHAAAPASTGALAALLQGLGRDDLRLAAREALVELGPAALPALLARLEMQAGASGSRDGALGLSEMGALLAVVRELGAQAAPALRAQAAAALTGELLRGRVPREAVVDAIGDLADRQSAALFAGLLSDGDVVVRRRALLALRRPGVLDGRALDALRGATRDGDLEVRRGAIEALGELGDTSAMPRLADLLWEGDAETRIAAAVALGRLSSALRPGAAVDARVLRVLEDAVTSARPGQAERRVRRAAALSLSQLLSAVPQFLPRALPALLMPLRRPRASDDGPLPEVVAALGGALRGRSDDAGRETLVELATAAADAHTPDAALALDALDALCALRPPQAQSRIARLLDQKDPLRRLRAAAALGCLLPSTDSALSPLLGVLSSDGDPRVRAEAAWALSRLSPNSSRRPRAIAGVRAALRRNLGERGDGGERANLVAALALLRAGEEGDAELFSDRDPAVRANAVLLLAPVARSPGLKARLRHLQVADWDHRVRAAAKRALAEKPLLGDRRHFLGMYHVDYDRGPLPEVRYRLTMPDGLVRIGTADGRGTAREELLPPGSCEVEVLDEGMKPR